MCPLSFQALNGSVPVDPLEELVHCTYVTTVPKWSDRHLATTVDSLFVLLSSFQRLLMSLCPGGNQVCEYMRTNFEFSLTEVLLHPVTYNKTPVHVEEFSDAQRLVNLTDDGELLLDDSSPLFDVSIVTTSKELSKVRSNLLKV